MVKFDYKPFRADVKREIVLQDLNGYQSLADMTGYSRKSITFFMSSQRNSYAIAQAIKKALKLKRNYGFEDFGKEESV